MFRLIACVSLILHSIYSFFICCCPGSEFCNELLVLYFPEIARRSRKCNEPWKQRPNERVQLRYGHFFIACAFTRNSCATGIEPTANNARPIFRWEGLRSSVALFDPASFEGPVGL